MIGTSVVGLFLVATAVVLGANEHFANELFMQAFGLLWCFIFIVLCGIGLYALFKRNMISIYVVSLHMGATAYAMVRGICELFNVMLPGNVIVLCGVVVGVVICALFAACGRSVAKSGTIVR